MLTRQTSTWPMYRAMIAVSPVSSSVRPRPPPSTEASLTGGLAVAAPGVAAELGEDRHHLVAEADRPFDVELLHGHRDDGRLALAADSYFRHAVAVRDDHAVSGHGDDPGVGADIGR